MSNTQFAAQIRHPLAPEPPLRWRAMWYVEPTEWMIGVKWNAGLPGARVKLGPFGVTFFKTFR